MSGTGQAATVHRVAIARSGSKLHKHESSSGTPHHSQAGKRWMMTAMLAMSTSQRGVAKESRMLPATSLPAQQCDERCAWAWRPTTEGATGLAHSGGGRETFCLSGTRCDAQLRRRHQR